MIGVLLALGSAVTWGCGDFLSGLMSRRLPLMTVLLGTQAAGVPFVLVAALVGGIPGTWAFVPLACLASLCGLVGLAALFRGMSVGAMSIVAPISATGAAVPVLLGLATGEVPTPLQGAGVLLALIGVMLASRPASDEPDSGPVTSGRRSALAAGASLGLVSALGFGAFYVVIRAATAAAQGDAFWPGLVARSTGSLVMLACALATRFRLAPSPRLASVLVLAGALDVTANVLYAAASYTDVGPLAAVLSSLFPVTTVALARVVLHERLEHLQTAGVLSALAGVALIAWR
jgi:drug/metabolite transporter (DMT)-like permease